MERNVLVIRYHLAAQHSDIIVIGLLMSILYKKHNILIKYYNTTKMSQLLLMRVKAYFFNALVLDASYWRKLNLGFIRRCKVIPQSDVFLFSLTNSFY